MKKFLIVLLMLSTVHTLQLVAQKEKSNNVSDSTKSSIEKDDFEEWKDFKNTFMEKPTLQLIYSWNQGDYNKDIFTSDFANINAAEIRLGWTKQKSLFSTNNVTKFKYPYFFFNFMEKTLNSKEISVNDLRNYVTKNVQFGFAEMKGYGYQFTPNSGLYLYHGTGISWNSINFESKIPLVRPTEQMIKNEQMLETYTGIMRFGQNFESGLKLQVYDPVSITASYSRSIIFPRHLFLQWAVSNMIEGIGQGIVDEFSKAVIKSSPSFGPIVNFVLKTGVSYGFYELRKTKMNWPFNSVSPLMYDSWKVGMSFEF